MHDDIYPEEKQHTFGRLKFGLPQNFPLIAKTYTADRAGNIQLLMLVFDFKGRGTCKKIIADFLDKYLVWVVLKPKISFLNFLEFIKVVKLAGKICQNSHSNGFFRFVLYITS